jgi:hydroxyacylglutathione hydrolase
MILQIPLGLSNAFLIRGERAVLVDSGRPKDVPKIIAALKRENLAVEDLSLILHSHGHWDHCGGTAELKAMTRAPVAIHRGDSDNLRRGHNGRLRATCLTGFLLKPFLSPGFPAAQPDVILEEETDLRAYGIDARAVSTPGHSAGSISVITADKEIIVGDLLMGGYWGGKLWRSRPNLHYYADDLPTLYASLRRVMELSPARVFVGHGGPLMLEAIRRRFRRQLA